MKNLFLFALAAALCCGCSESSIGDDSELAGPNPSITDGVLNIHVAERGTLDAVLAAQNIDVRLIDSLKITGVLNEEDFEPIRSMDNLRNLDLADVNLSILPAEAFCFMNIELLVLPNTLTEIGNMAFEHCGKLTSIEIPASVETIEKFAFQHCSNLTDVTFEKGSKLKTIGGGFDSIFDYGAFLDCSSLTSIKIPASVETIEATTFKGCSKLATVTFEKSSKLKTIRGGEVDCGAFLDCSSLTSIEIPASVETIEAAAFKGCSKLATVTFEKGSKLKTIGGGYSGGPNYYGAFLDCSSLTSIEIPASVETIEATAFKRCSKLATVTFEKGSKLKTIGGGFDSFSRDYYGVFSDCTSLTSIKIPASVETIEEYAFHNCSKLTDVTFEKGSKLETIGSCVFDGSNLTSIEIPASVETIEKDAFSNCSRLATVTFEKGSKLKTIGQYAFCLPELQTVDMSACTQVETIGYSAFSHTYNLRLFKIGTATPPKCGGGVFWWSGSDSSVLKVPSGCVDAYKAADEWREFASITELDE